MPDQTAAFDHVIHWVDDLDATSSEYDAAGLAIQPALTMPGFRNATWSVDDERYVELATVEDWAAVEQSKYAEGVEVLRPAVEALGGPGLLTFAVDVPDVRATAARLREAGHDVHELEVRFEEKNAGFVEVFVRDLPAGFPFFISYDPPRAELARMRAQHRAEHGPPWPSPRADLVALLARSDDPETDARRLAELVGCERSGAVVDLPGAQVRFEHGAPTGLYGIAVRGLPAAEPVEIAGVTVHFEH